MTRFILISFCLFSIGLSAHHNRYPMQESSPMPLVKKSESGSLKKNYEYETPHTHTFFQEFEDDDQGLLYYLAWFLHDLFYHDSNR